MSLRLRQQLVVAICLCAQSCATSRAAEGQESSVQSQQAAALDPTSDPVEIRRRSNQDYVGIKVRTSVSRRFEMYDPHSRQALLDLKSMGFTQVILDWPELHSAATDAGLDVVLANWWTQETKPEEIEKGLERAREVAPQSLIESALWMNQVATLPTRRSVSIFTCTRN